MPKSNKRPTKIIDGNAAAASVAYHLSEVCAIYPITPSSPMAEEVDRLAARGEHNFAGEVVRAVSMQSEAGAAGLLHGALSGGSLAATFTSSQGLLLMLPNLFKIAGEGLPAVVYVAARTVATHALSIFGDHSDVYAVRSAGTALLCLSSVQEVADLSPIAHLTALRGRLPVLVFFDGFRTSHELAKVNVWTKEQLDTFVDSDALTRFRESALTPSRPVMRGTAENGDLYFQHREASNRRYDAFSDIMEEALAEVNRKIGTDYHCFAYYGAPDAERVVVAMGSVSGTVREAVDHLTAKGEKVGFVQVRLYHPFDIARFDAALPETCRTIAVLDRAKEPGAAGEPLYLEVTAALKQSERQMQIEVIGGRYGLSSKDTTPGMVLSVFAHLKKAHPESPFTIGITDDVTHLSLASLPDPETESGFVLRFFGMGGDGSVSALKNAAKLLGERYFVQAYFRYDSKKTSGVTIGDLRLSNGPIRGSYIPKLADVILCGRMGYLRSDFPLADRIKEGGSLIVATDLSEDEFVRSLPDFVKGRLARRRVKVYLLPIARLAEENGIGKRTGTLLIAAWLALGIGRAERDAAIPSPADACQMLAEGARRAYASKGADAVARTVNAIEAVFAAPPVQIPLPREWASLSETANDPMSGAGMETEAYLADILRPTSRMRGDEVPVSVLLPYAEGSLPAGTSVYEKRAVSDRVARWHPERCIQCGRCSFVCPHAAIRAALVSQEEKAAAPAEIPLTARAGGQGMGFTITISPADCTGCTLCTRVCPVSALSMEARAEGDPRQEVFDYIYEKVSEKEPPAKRDSVRGVQFSRPLQEFSGACAGCAQAAYARLVTQLFGRRMIISNATGCSSIWGGSAPVSPYAAHPEGGGPAWANSLFEDNAEHGLGIATAVETLRRREIELVRALVPMAEGELAEAAEEYLSTLFDGRANEKASRRLEKLLRAAVEDDENQCENLLTVHKRNRKDILQRIWEGRAHLSKKSLWLFGGDGWAYDIGFGGLIHVLSTNTDVNVLVFDTEVYSNTGGQASGASRQGQVARFAEGGKQSGKKNLAEIATTLTNVYVAQIAMGADQNQTLRALIEAEAYPGPSLVIAYSPCELHGVTGGMGESQGQMARAVECGYLTLFRYNPLEQTFSVDSKPPRFEAFRSFLLSENRYARLSRERPAEAEELLSKAEQTAKRDRARLLALGNALSECQE